MNLKKDAGYKAAEYVKDGDILGLGTGSTTHYFIEKVGMRIKEEGINVMGIPTSFQSLLLAKQWNIPITSLEEHDIDPIYESHNQFNSTDYNDPYKLTPPKVSTFALPETFQENPKICVASRISKVQSFKITKPVVTLSADKRKKRGGRMSSMQKTAAHRSLPPLHLEHFH